MSASAELAAPGTETHGHGDGHGHDHPQFLAHHFESFKHQFDAGKLGIWLFLITEVLFFSGLFCFYSVYRYHHPEIFHIGHQFLDKQLGALNTVVLLFSSLTMAWGVRCAQLGQKQGLVVCLALTLACAGAFMVVKYFEYASKISHGVMWASQFDPQRAAEYLAEHHAAHGGHGPASHGSGSHSSGSHAAATAGGEPHGAAEHGAGKEGEHAKGADASAGEHGQAASAAHPVAPLPREVGIYFSIYFGLTGLHGLHIIGGMVALTWLLLRSIRGDFGPEYFGPVDYVGLYWHLVDLIWIYLFPLLYLVN